MWAGLTDSFHDNQWLINMDPGKVSVVSPLPAHTNKPITLVSWQVKLLQNQPYDESVEVSDAEEVVSTNPTPRMSKPQSG